MHSLPHLLLENVEGAKELLDGLDDIKLEVEVVVGHRIRYEDLWHTLLASLLKLDRVLEIDEVVFLAMNEETWRGDPAHLLLVIELLLDQSWEEAEVFVGDTLDRFEGAYKYDGTGFAVRRQMDARTRSDRPPNYDYVLLL